MSNEIVLALIATLLGSSGMITAIITAMINRKKSRAEAEKIRAEAEKIRAEAQADTEKNRADAAKIITDATKEILGEYRLRNDELEGELSALKGDFRELRKDFDEVQAELITRDKQYQQEQALQDQAIENTNAMVLKLELLNIIYVSQIRSLGVEPIVEPTEIASISVDDLQNIAQGLSNIEGRKKASPKATKSLGEDGYD